MNMKSFLLIFLIVNSGGLLFVQARASLDELKERALSQLQRNDEDITKLKDELSNIAETTNQDIRNIMDKFFNKTDSHLEDALNHANAVYQQSLALAQQKGLNVEKCFESMEHVKEKAKDIESSFIKCTHIMDLGEDYEEIVEKIEELTRSVEYLRKQVDRYVEDSLANRHHVSKIEHSGHHMQVLDIPRVSRNIKKYHKSLEHFLKAVPKCFFEKIHVKIDDFANTVLKIAFRIDNCIESIIDKHRESASFPVVINPVWKSQAFSVLPRLQ